ncbi:MAG: hypothetical protein RBT11_12870 [Desulfobacterales bacterium]|jgi:hypothetical protein|nr:hypothetical protein [Desulfobacterales bacterium]
MLTKGQKEKYVGLAGLFAPEQLRSYFLNYIYFIIGVEIFIFLISFMSHLGPGKGPFPWKFYFYVAFIVPVAITFLLGLFIIAFNRYIFGGDPAIDDSISPKGEEGAQKSRVFKFNSMLHSLGHVPFVPTLFVLVLGAMLLYKIDDIFLFIFKAGEKAISYILIAAAVLVGAGILFGLFWVVSNYMLSKKHMEQEYQYRKEVMKTMGFLVLDDNMVITKDGKILTRNDVQLIEGSTTDVDDLKILPAPANHEDRAQ